jgi:hypothetical protein
MTFPDLYPPVTIPTQMPTWEDIERLALNFPILHQVVMQHRRGDLTREQALMLAVFWLADAFQRLFSAEINRRANSVSERIVYRGPAPEADPSEKSAHIQSSARI